MQSRQVTQLPGLALAVLFTILVGSVAADDRKGDDRWRTFRGHYAHVGDAPGSGRATPLGRFTQKGMVVVQPDGSAEGTEVFTAANGDQLSMEVKGAPTADCGSATTVVIPICGTFTFTGGTGRFCDASGGAYFVGVITFDASGPPHIAVDFGGIIQY